MARARVLAARKVLKDAKAYCEGLEEIARHKNIPPGWLRD